MTGPLRAAILLVALGLTLPLSMYSVALLMAGRPFEPFLAMLGLLTSISAAVGTTILWRRPGNRVGTLLLVGGVALASAATAWPWLAAQPVLPTDPLGRLLAWWAPIGVLPSVFVLFPTVVLVFPDGHTPGPRWTWAFAVAASALVVGMGLYSLAPWPIDRLNGTLGNPFAVPGIPGEVRVVGEVVMVVAVLVGFALALASVVARFRRSDGVERAQVKWLAGAVALNCVLFPVSYATPLQPEDLFDALSVMAAALIPLSIGVAVLRYHLYEIDRIISRTLSWAVVTGVLVGTFAVLVVGLQTALSDVTTQGGTLAVAVSTLVAFALFQPVRGLVQRAVDRRFDRARYDSDSTAAAFAARLRSEVDLDAVTGDLTGSVDHVLRPRTMSLWLKGSDR